MTVTILRFARTSEKWQLQGLSRLLGLVRVVPVVTALSPIHVLDSALRPHPGRRARSSQQPAARLTRVVDVTR